MFVFTLSPFLCLMVCTFPSSWFLVHCASSPLPSPPLPPLILNPACLLHVSCACSSIFIVAFYVSRDCIRDLFICAFHRIHSYTYLLDVSFSVWRCLYNNVLYVHKCTVSQRTSGITVKI